ncbi:MAG: lycopene cyclase domain-containing protein [Candidatus Microsaccharimonas sp.]
MEWFYLLGLLIGISGMAVIDWRYKLAFWKNSKQTGLTLFFAVFIFILWDFFGIFLGIFYHGKSDYALPFTIVPEFPVEELFFLFLLCYCTLVIYNGVSKWRSRT